MTDKPLSKEELRKIDHDAFLRRLGIYEPDERVNTDRVTYVSAEEFAEMTDEDCTCTGLYGDGKGRCIKHGKA